MRAEDIDKIFDEGQEDVVQYFDVEKARHPNREIRRVNVDFPLWVVEALDAEAARLGVTRQSVIKVWIADRLSDVSTSR